MTEEEGRWQVRLRQDQEETTARWHARLQEAEQEEQRLWEEPVEDPLDPSAAGTMGHGVCRHRWSPTKI